MIEETLKKLEFSEKEIAIYLTIVKRGKVSPAEVSKITGINRATVYAVADELKKRGVIAEDLGSPTRQLIAQSPDDLSQIVEREERKVEERKNLVQSAIQELESLASEAGRTIPKIVYIPEQDIEAHLYKQTPKWNKSILELKESWWGFQDHTFAEQYEKWIDWLWLDDVMPKEVAAKLITNKSGIEQTMKKKQFERRKVKFWRVNSNFTATTWVCGNYLIMIVTNQSPRYLIEINDLILAHNTREVLKGIWKEIK